MFSPAKIEGVEKGIILGGASVQIKDFGSTPIPLQRQISIEGMGAPIPCGENTESIDWHDLYYYYYNIIERTH